MCTATAPRGLAHLFKVSTYGRGFGSFAGHTNTTMLTLPLFSTTGAKFTVVTIAPPLFQPFACDHCLEQQRQTKQIKRRSTLPLSEACKHLIQ